MTRAIRADFDPAFPSINKASWAANTSLISPIAIRIGDTRLRAKMDEQSGLDQPGLTSLWTEIRDLLKKQNDDLRVQNAELRKLNLQSAEESEGEAGSDVGSVDGNWASLNRSRMWCPRKDIGTVFYRNPRGRSLPCDMESRNIPLDMRERRDSKLVTSNEWQYCR